jgi:LacI family transcriptional regulator
MRSVKKSAGKKRSGRMDIRGVAERAGVSIATVSRAINRVPSVDPKMAKRVWAAVAELNYLPNTQARALVSGRSRLIGVIISDITNPFFPELIQSFEDIAVPAGYEILIGSTAHDTRRMEICIQRMLERKVDAVAVMTFGIEEPLLDRLAEREIPLVFIDIAPKGEGMIAISVDYGAGIDQAVQHLAVLGHRKIAFISGPGQLHSAVLRKEAFRHSLTRIGVKVPASYLPEGDHTLEGGMKVMEKLIKNKNLPTAIICSNDMTAIGVMHAAAAANLRIPEDLSIIGFDDIHMARYMIPPLTSVQMSCRDLAHEAFTALRSQLEAEGSTRKTIYHVSTRLNVRQTTSYPRGSIANLRAPAASTKSI